MSSDGAADEVRFEFPIEQGHIVQFARALGERGAAYVADGLAPLTFTMAADHFNPRALAASGEVSLPEGFGQSFHAEQRFTYRRHPRAGETLTARSRPGDTWEKLGRRGGRLEFRERLTDYFDADGELVITARWVVCLTERARD
jgi:hypothetical protein